jgi:hypothetical protein
MRRILALLLSVGMALCSFIGLPTGYAKSQRHKAAHIILMTAGDRKAGCSATAVGPHTLLTAEHCYVGQNTLLGMTLGQDVWGPEKLYIDSTVDEVRAGTAVQHVIKRIILDHQDHMLLDFGSDTHFTTFIPMKFREPVQGEHYYLFGNPALIVDQYREGYVTGKDNMSPDEEGLEYFISHPCYLLSGPVVGGDSGSSIYALDGTLIGITTYGLEDGAFIGSYPIRFTASQINESLI